MSKHLDIIATLGPTLLSEEELVNIKKRGATILRINGAHSSPSNADRVIKRIRQYSIDIKIMIDLPGNKIRTTTLEIPIKLEKDAVFKLEAYQVNHPNFFELVSPGTIITAHDSEYTFEVVSALKECLELKSHVNGMLKSNKGLHVVGNVQDQFDFIFEKDQELIEVALENKIDYLAASFVRTAADIREVKEIIGDRKIELISKIETKMAVEHVDEIFEEVNYILIDRGDLSSSVGLLDVVPAEEYIVSQARKKKGIKVFLATQFLTNMLHSPIPSIAEVFSLYKVVFEGVDGIQLSEETAIGEYGPECVDTIKAVFEKVKNNKES